MRTVSTLCFIATLTLLAACEDAETTPGHNEPTNDASANNTDATTLKMVAVGESTREIKGLKYAALGTSDYGCGPGVPDEECKEPPLTICDLAGPPGTTIAMIEVLAADDKIKLDPDCSGPYRGTMHVLSVDVFAVVAGEDLPQSTTILSRLNTMSFKQRAPGTLLLVGLRQSGGEWFTEGLAADLSIDNDEMFKGTGDREVDLPNIFEDLLALTDDTLENFDARCERAASGARLSTWTQEQYDHFIHTPTSGTCTVVDHTPEPEENPCSEETSENPPACCTDDSIPCE